ncbi:proteasome subunit beta type-5, putative [Plasmodium vinckei vinckei]|uniref:Proteasome subunit beta n=1 Tax=Plasmodium vinckei vinckei TaxID=54757 RepID=A0A449BW50_PLAVN|nr:proteasome subunit beta type-5, putative [Plasmodium vinckei vinckei]KEG03416.1 20S proteasome subunit beta 5 [Plasmodium vinckei vinckei]VEV57707.1 proteasome subunit beta type-5, putative [Plasmodium vinckei vinckei]
MMEYSTDFMTQIDNLINDEEENVNTITDELEFCLAPISVPRDFIKYAKTENKKLFDFHKGTTTLAFKFKEGIIVAVDSRASMGSFISSQNVEKIIEINKHILGTMAGGAADCLYWEKYLGQIIKIYELRNNEKISVRAASTILSNILYQYKGYGLCCGIILSGYDHTGFNMFYIDDEGKKVEGNLFSCGSGSTYAYSILDSAYDYNLSVEEAVELGRNAIYHATFRDGGSGGKVRVFYIHKDGYSKIIEGEDVYDLHYHYTNPSQKDQYVM